MHGYSSAQRNPLKNITLAHLAHFVKATLRLVPATHYQMMNDDKNTARRVLQDNSFCTEHEEYSVQDLPVTGGVLTSFGTHAVFCAFLSYIFISVPRSRHK